MRSIYKYELPLTRGPVQIVPIPTKYICSDVLTAAIQDGKICLWTEVDTDIDPIDHTIFIVGTGNRVPDEAEVYIGTVQDEHGFVWHVYSEHQHEDDVD